MCNVIYMIYILYAFSRACSRAASAFQSIMIQMNLTFTATSKDKSYRLELFQDVPSNATMWLMFEAVKI